MENNQTEETSQSLNHFMKSPGYIIFNTLTKVYNKESSKEQLVRFIFDTNKEDGFHPGFICDEEGNNLLCERVFKFETYDEFYSLSMFITRNGLMVK